MADGSRTIAIRFTGDTKGLNAAASSGQRSLSKWRSGFSKLGSFAKAAGKAIGIGLLAAGAAAFAFGKGAVSAASDLNETINKTRVIFGDQAKAVLNWSKSSATAFGLSRNEALSYASDLGNLFSQLGFSDKATTKLSKSTVKFAADLGSFHNLDTGDVLERISAAMRGEFDSLQALIPNINAARVEQVAMAQTGKKTADALTAQEKAAATLAIIHKDGAAASGDFAKTSGSLANQKKILSAQVENLQAKLGKFLLPIMVKLAGFTTSTVIPALERFSAWFMRVAVPAIQNFARQFMESIQPLIAWFRRNWPEIQRIVRTVLRNIVEIIRGVIQLVRAIWRKWGNDILRLAKITWNFIFRMIKNAMKTIQGVINVITGLIKGDWGQVWKGIKQIFGAQWDQIKNILRTTLRAALELIRLWWRAFKSIWGGIWRGAKDITRRAWDGIRDGISNTLGGIKNRVVSVWNSIVGFIKNIPSRIGGVFSGMWSGIVGGLKDAINSALGLPLEFPGWDWPGPGGIGPKTLIPALAHGGRAERGRTFLVGERGPELFVPTENGTVVPNHRMPDTAGSGITIERLEVKAMGSQFKLRQVLDSVAWSVAS